MNRDLHFYSNGKLLLTGEYLVMVGAQSLAVPVKFGQEMEVLPVNNSTLKWEAFIKDKLWFETEFDLPGMEILATTDPEKGLYLKKAILAAKDINPLFLAKKEGLLVKTKLNYPQEWGLGSSSTFINNLANWAKIDAMELNKSISSGSGYDIACAEAKSAILFQIINGRPHWEFANYNPSFSNHLFFIYLGQKQNTAESVHRFKENYKVKARDIDYISELTQQLLKADTLDKAISILNLHEQFLSALLNIIPVKQKLFPDFEGAVKSLGAWGGDFALLASPLGIEEVIAYLLKKDFHTLFKFEELVIESLNNKN